MKKIFFVLIPLIFYSTRLMAQSVGINNTTPDASSILDIKSNNKGLLIPRMNTAAVSTISNPAKGLLVLDTSTNQLMVNMGTTTSPNWQSIVFKSGWNLKGNSGIDSATNFIGTTDSKPLLFRVNNLPAGQIHPTQKNVSFGLNAFANNNGGTLNTAMGNQALYSNTGGFENTAHGFQALFSNINGNQNVAIGAQALYVNTSGSQNTAIGDQSLKANAIGQYNTAVGIGALASNTVDNNTAIGSFSLSGNTSGVGNVGVGMEALGSNSTGEDNTATGYTALFSNTTGANNTAFGSQALFSNTTTSFNTAIGYQALYQSNGLSNTGVGVYSLYNNAGNYNVAVGVGTLQSNTTGHDNTALGMLTLSNNTTGLGNTGTGSNVLSFNTTGTNNTATGFQALQSNTTGSSNAATGYHALSSNTSGGANTANGWETLFSNTTGTQNTAIGFDALHSNIAGAANTAVGESALNSNTSGSFNISVGANSQPYLEQGQDNIALGFEAGACFNFSNLTNSIVVGAFTCTQNSNYALFGTTTTTWNGGNLAWSTFSDARIKRNIKEDVAGLSFIMKLKPVTYNRSVKAMSELTGNEPREYPEKYDIEKIRFTGFIAQDVEKAAKEINYDFSGITKPKSSTDLYSLSYESFVVPLVKGMQEQQAMIDQQRQKINDLEKDTNTLKEQNQKILAALDKLNQNNNK